MRMSYLKVSMALSVLGHKGTIRTLSLWSSSLGSFRSEQAIGSHKFKWANFGSSVHVDCRGLFNLVAKILAFKHFSTMGSCLNERLVEGIPHSFDAIMEGSTRTCVFF